MAGKHRFNVVAEGLVDKARELEWPPSKHEPRP
ncbi:hypothetical protein RA210_U10040 [Rubrivivax sp. A210]|nr:hypothetical protein RA210_U10040 [Rubrivivax sp. A210]